MVTGPSLGYFLQSLKFKKTKSSKGFSKSICLIIYLAQILRVFFWIGKPFKITLLYQSILIIIFQLSIHVNCIYVSKQCTQFYHYFWIICTLEDLCHFHFVNKMIQTLQYRLIYQHIYHML